MTTLKEYKAMMEGATDAPIGYADLSIIKNWHILRGTVYAGNEKCYLAFSKEPFQSEFTNCDTPIYLHADKLTPSLIRVIELAEDALSQVSTGAAVKHPQIMDNVRQALSEIRKLKV